MKVDCKVHSKEMQLLGLRRQLNDPRLDEKQKRKLWEEIAELEKILGLQPKGQS